MAKQGALFVLSADNGDIEEHTDQGLYFHDMRYLSACALRLNGSMPVVLLSDATDGNRQIFEMTNLDLRGRMARSVCPKRCLPFDATARSPKTVSSRSPSRVTRAALR